MEATIEIQTRYHGESTTYTFSEFPIRLGRDDACELQLPYAFVSRTHARIERTDTGFAVVDEGSRYGVFLHGERIPPHEKVPLADQDELAIEMLALEVCVREPTLGLGDAPTSLYAEQLVPKFLASTSDDLEAYRAARLAALGAVGTSLSAIPVSERSIMVRELLAVHPELTVDPDFGLMFEACEARRTPPASPAEASAALLGLQKLAAKYVADLHSPSNANDIEAFVARIDRALEVFFAAKAHLDLVYRCETTDSTVEDSARTSAEARRLGQDLLDWTSADPNRAAVRLEDDFLAIIAHHSKLIAEVEKAIRSIVRELAPDEIEAAAKRTRWHGPFWARSLWRHYARRHASVAAQLAFSAAEMK